MDAVIQVMTWWGLSLLLGAISLPLAWRVFSFLPDRGLGAARMLGLLIMSYLSWLIGFAHYSTATVLLAWAGLAGLSFWILSRHGEEIKTFLKEHLGLYLVYETLFLFLLCLWAFVRMHHPNIVDQEKFMDLAFFNAISRADQFPPFDPWLAAPGNYINYYYFGYFVMSNFARLTGLDPAVAYNLVIAFVFALTGQTVFSLAWNLTRSLWPGFVGVATLSLLGNLHAGVAQKWFPFNYFAGINWWDPTRLIRDVARPAADGSRAFINHWWNSADPQVLAQAGVAANAAKDAAISEFPIFSFIHGDMHPHFTAIPFVLLSLVFALNLLRNDNRDPLGPIEKKPLPIIAGLAGLVCAVFAFLKPGFLPNAVPAWSFLALGAVCALFLWPRNIERGLGLGLIALCLSSVLMTNTWDLPAYGLVASMALLLHQHYHQRLNKENWLTGWFLPSCAMLLGLVLLSAPFLIFFENPAHGIAYSQAKTGMRDTLIFWGFFLVVLLPFLFVRLRVWALSITGRLEDVKKTAAATKVSKCQECGARLRPGKPFCAQCGTKNVEPVPAAGVDATLKINTARVPAFVADCLTLFVRPGLAMRNTTVKWCATVIFVVLAALYFGLPTTAVFVTLAIPTLLLLASREEGPDSLFGLMLVLTGALLVTMVDWVLLKDTFYGNPSLARMNTIFKFYFQGWILFAVALPFALWWMSKTLARLAGDVPRTAFVLVVCLVGLLAARYPIMAVDSVWDTFSVSQNLSPTLDGSQWLKRDFPGDWEMIQTLRDKVDGHPVIVEAVGGAYTRFARVTSYTGLPTIVGWGNHESQWRKNWPQKEEQDVDRIYKTLDINEAKTLLEKYNAVYVFAGAMERQKYSRDELAKFGQFMEVAFSNNKGTIVYKVKGK